MSSSPLSPLGSRLRGEKQRKRKTVFICAAALAAVCLIGAVLLLHKSDTDSAASKGAAQSEAAEAPAVASPAAFDTLEKQDQVVRKFFALCTHGNKFDAACVLDNAEPLCPSRPTTELEVVGQSCGEDRACWQDFLRSCGAFPQKDADVR